MELLYQIHELHCTLINIDNILTCIETVQHNRDSCSSSIVCNFSIFIKFANYKKKIQSNATEYKGVKIRSTTHSICEAFNATTY